MAMILGEPKSNSSHTVDINPSPSNALNFLWLELTGKCNLHCVHCYADSGPQRRLHEHMSPDDWGDVLDQAAALGCRVVQFIGGEPTIYPALPALIERARALGFETIEVYTNGTMFKPRIKEALHRHKVNLAFSVYAADSQTHDLVTRQAGSLERTLESIRWALASGLSVRAGIIEMDTNAGHTERTQELLHEIGVVHICIDRVRGVGRGATDNAIEVKFGELCGACTRGRLAVTASGEILPCVFSRFWPVGHTHQGLRTVVEGEPLRIFRDKMEQTGRRSGIHLPKGTDICPPDFVNDPPPPPGPDPRPFCTPDFVNDPPPPPEPEPPPVCDPTFAPR